MKGQRVAKGRKRCRRIMKFLLASAIYYPIAVCVVTADAAPDPKIYQYTALLSNSEMQPYDMSEAYGGRGILYNFVMGLQWNVVIGGGPGIPFQVADMLRRAATLWIRGFGRLGQTVQIAPAPNAFAANLLVQVDNPFNGFAEFTGEHQAVGITFPPEGAWLENPPGAQPRAPGIFLNPNGLAVTQEQYEAIKSYVDENYTQEQIAEMIMLVTITHEMGHALGLGHPGEGRGFNDPRFRNRFVFERNTFTRNFNTAPIMTRNAVDFFEALHDMLGRRVRMEDIMVADPEVETIIQDCVTGPRREKQGETQCGYVRVARNQPLMVPVEMLINQ